MTDFLSSFSAKLAQKGQIIIEFSLNMTNFMVILVQTTPIFRTYLR